MMSAWVHALYQNDGKAVHLREWVEGSGGEHLEELIGGLLVEAFSFLLAEACMQGGGDPRFDRKVIGQEAT